MPSVSLSTLLRSFSPTQVRSVAADSAGEVTERLARQATERAASALRIPDTAQSTASIVALTNAQQSAQKLELYAAPARAAQSRADAALMPPVESRGPNPESNVRQQERAYARAVTESLTRNSTSSPPVLDSAQQPHQGKPVLMDIPQLNTEGFIRDGQRTAKNRADAAREAYRAMQSRSDGYADALARAQRTGLQVSTTA